MMQQENTQTTQSGILGGAPVAPPATPSVTPAVAAPVESGGEESTPELSNQDAQLAPEQLAQVEAYTDNATKMLYSPKTQPAWLQELQASNNPIENIAETANHLHKILQAGLEKTGEQMTDQTMFLGATHLVSELNVLADAAGLFTLDEKQRMDSLQLTLLLYFKRGIDDGTIDPVELQKDLEPLLTDEQRQMGIANMGTTGVSKTQPPKGASFRGNAQQQGQPAQPTPSAEVPPGILNQEGR